MASKLNQPQQVTE